MGVTILGNCIRVIFSGKQRDTLHYCRRKAIYAALGYQIKEGVTAIDRTDTDLVKNKTVATASPLPWQRRNSSHS